MTSKALGAIAGRGPNFAVFNATSHGRAGVPPCGWTVLRTRPPVSPTSLENEFLRVEVGNDGVLKSIWDKEVGREVLSGPANFLELHEDNPRKWDAWDLDIEHRDSADIAAELKRVFDQHCAATVQP